ncbi:hypothetical protein V5F77_17515 [Xanthobacter sp. DSM 24535]|uniref:hypothetical protein n=1 Tax=Roseixanthobacter psychrophilus TaxID=3119917 RepID=UPI003728C839
MTLALTTAEYASSWRFSAQRALDPEPLLVGRSVEQALELLPRVFNLCAAAHRAAAAAALGQVDAVREDAIHAETARDHGLALFHGWPVLLGSKPDRAGLTLLAGGQASDVARHVCGEDLSEFSESDLNSWLETGSEPAAHLLRDLRDRLDPAWGRAALASVEVETLDVQPTDPRETTVLDRVRDVPVIRELLMSEGPSLFVRLFARVVDLFCALSGRAARPPFGRSRAGAGYAQAARGLLVHRAEARDGLILAYRVHTPSAWNLAPDGLLERMLAALPARREAPMLAKLAESAVNPCVPLTLQCAGEI